MRAVKAGIDEVKRRTPSLVDEATGGVAEPASARWLRTGSHGAAEPARSPARGVPRSRIRVGIPRVLNMYACAPLFSAYLESLGVPASNIVYSGQTTEELYRRGSTRGAIDPCYPSKVALSHVHDLVMREHRGAPSTSCSSR